MSRKMQRLCKRNEHYLIVEMGHGDVTLDAVACQGLVENAAKIIAIMKPMDDETRRSFTRAMIADNPCVVGIYPDPDGPDFPCRFLFHVIRGAHLIAGGAKKGNGALTLGWPCVDLQDAKNIALDLGDGRNEGTLQ